MDSTKNKTYTLLGIIMLLVTIIGLTYAFFAPQQGGTTSTNATVTSNTTDLLTFSINRDISFTVNQANFEENGENQSGDATATATLTPNNKTGAATMNYYLYLNIESNPTVYSVANTNHDPELMLQVFDGSNQLVTLAGLGVQKTIKGVTGYDITGIEGIRTLLYNHAISASNNQATIDNWRIVITLINLDVIQNDNTGKMIEAEVIIRQDEQKFSGTIYRNNSIHIIDGSSILAINNVTVYCAYNSAQNVDSCDYGYYWSTISECESALLNIGLSGFVCQQETRSLTGIGSYVTNLNTRLSQNYYVYCPVGAENPFCNNGFFYDETEQECLDNYYVEDHGYTCETGILRKSFYLKHVIEDNIIQSTETCLYYNDSELCIDSNYWDTDGATTLNKLQTEMETVFGAQVDYCYNADSWIRCEIGDLMCDVGSDGYNRCRDGGSGCDLMPNGMSACW